MPARPQMCCAAGAQAFPNNCPWHMPWRVTEALTLEMLSAPTHSMDDDYPDEMVEVFGGWFAAAIMEWRECAA